MCAARSSFKSALSENQAPAKRIVGFVYHQCFSEHNHALRKDALIEAKRQTFQHFIPANVCLTLISLSRYGPTPTKVLHGYMQEQFPDSKKNTSAMICNLRMKTKKLEIQLPNMNDIPGVTMKRLFDPFSLEFAPQKFSRSSHGYNL